MAKLQISEPEAEDDQASPTSLKSHSKAKGHKQRILQNNQS